jgi:hypothetical protein
MPTYIPILIAKARTMLFARAQSKGNRARVLREIARMFAKTSFSSLQRASSRSRGIHSPMR